MITKENTRENDNNKNYITNVHIYTIMMSWGMVTFGKTSLYTMKMRRGITGCREQGGELQEDLGRNTSGQTLPTEPEKQLTR